MQPWYKSPLGWMLLSCFLVALWAFSSLAKADDVVEFPEQELSRESVLPVFDQPEAVKKRYVPTDGRVEIAGFLGAGLNDAFLNEYMAGLEAQYHLSELHAVGLIAEGFSSQNTSYVGQIQSPTGPDPTGLIPFGQNPAPKVAVLGEYEFTPYYGKISLSKQTVVNLNISATARAGMLNLSVGSSSVAGGLGINQRFFFTRNFGLKVDLSALMYQKTDIIPVQPTNSTVLNIFVSLGVVYLLPSL